MNCLSDTPSVLHFQKQGQLKDSAKKAIKKKFKVRDPFLLQDFNAEFPEIVKQQSSLNVFDADLRKAMQEKNKELILHKYLAFLKRYRDLDFAANKDKYILYSPKDVEDMLFKMLQGRSA